jgi:hypothetical protein
MEEKERPPFFTHCPVCNAETPQGATHCPQCRVDLEIARSNFIKDAALTIGKYGFAVGQQNALPKKKHISFGSVIGFILLCSLFLLTWGVFNSTQQTPPTRQPSPTVTPRITPRVVPTENTSIRLAFPECFHWSQVNVSMEGRKVCVYGIVHSLYATDEAWTRIRFTDKPNSFFMYDPNFIYPNIRPGWCVLVSGMVEQIQNIPYIKITEGMDAGIPPKPSDCQ